MANSAAERALNLLAVDPGLGGVVACGGLRLAVPNCRRIPPNAALCGYHTPWGWQPGLLDKGGALTVDLDLLTPETQSVLAQRLDAGGCTLVASCTEPPWAHLADRVAFLVTDRPYARPPRGRPIAQSRAVEAIAAAAILLQVEGHRAELFALQAAAAVARADGRTRLCQGDVTEAIQLVLAPRARAVPEANTPEQADPPPTQAEGTAAEQAAAAPPLPVPLPALPRVPVQTRPALHGAPVRTIPGRRRQGSLALTPTMLAALPWQKLRGRAGTSPPTPAPAPVLAIRPQDLRWQLRQPRTGRLLIFVVDGSGSMGPRRLGQAKGAVLQALQEAYRRRDRVALIAAAGAEARLLLPPARAVEQARRPLAALPAGGATPLAGALLLAHRLATMARRLEDRSALLLLLSDGRANQPLAGSDRTQVRPELKRCCLLLRAEGVQSLVLSPPGKEAQEVSHWLGGSFQLIGRGHGAMARRPASP